MRLSIVATALLTTLAAAAGGAQQPAADPPGPKVGDVAPDFELPGATRYGLLTEPVKLSDYHGKVVVIAFFFQARTRG